MPIRLPDDEETHIETENSANPFYENIDSHSVLSNSTVQHRQTLIYQLIKYLSQFQLFRIPILNWTVIMLFLIMIFNLIKKYESMYAEDKLLTTITANSLLYGLSDSIAQSISCFIGNTSRSNTRNQRSNSVVSIGLYNFNDADTMFADYGDTSSLQRQTTNMDEGTQYQMLSKQTDIDIFNLQRFIGFICWGVFMAFIQVGWYWILNHFYTKEPTLVSVLERVLTDQLLFSPISLFSFFSYSNFVLEAGDKFTLHEKIKKIYLSTLACNYMVWPLVQFINFLVMPKRFQVPFSSSVGVIWNCFLSMRNASNS